MKCPNFSKTYLIIHVQPFIFPSVVSDHAIICSINHCNSSPIDLSEYELVANNASYQQYQCLSNIHFNTISNLDTVLSDFILLSKPNVERVVILGDISKCKKTFDLMREHTIQLVPAFDVQPVQTDQIMQLIDKMSGYYTVHSFLDFCFFKPQMEWFITLISLQLLRVSHIVKVNSLVHEVFVFDEEQRQIFQNLNQIYKQKLLSISAPVIKAPIQVMIPTILPTQEVRNDQLFFDFINEFHLHHEEFISITDSGTFIGNLILNGELFVATTNENATATIEECKKQLFALAYQKLKSNPNVYNKSAFDTLEALIKEKNIDEMVIEHREDIVDYSMQIKIKFIIGFTEFVTIQYYPTLEQAKNELAKKMILHLKRVNFKLNEDSDSVNLDNEFVNDSMTANKSATDKKYICMLNGTFEINLEYCSSKNLPYPEYTGNETICPHQGVNLYEQVVTIGGQQIIDPDHTVYFTKKDAKEHISKIAYEHFLTQ